MSEWVILFNANSAIFQLYHGEGHLIKFQSSLIYLGIDIDKYVSGGRTVNTIIKKIDFRLKLSIFWNKEIFK
jgi:hypothetical protein